MLVVLFVLSSSPNTDVLARMGLHNAAEVDAYMKACDLGSKLPSDVGSGLRFYADTRAKLRVTTAELEACAQGHDATCAWTESALAQLCHTPRAPRLVFAPDSTVHAVVRGIAAGLAETPSERKRALQFFDTSRGGSSDPFASFRAFGAKPAFTMPTVWGKQAGDGSDEAVKQLVDAGLLDASQHDAAERALKHLHEKLVAFAMEEYGNIPLTLRTTMLRGDASPTALLDYATQSAHTWCRRLDNTEAWQAAARPGGTTAEFVCHDAEERDVCLRIFATRAGIALVRSVAVFVVAMCHLRRR